MTRALGFLLLISSCALAGSLEKNPHAPLAGTYDPLDHWELRFETGALWDIGGGATPLDYVFLPQIITLKTPHVFKTPLGGGELALRSRFSFLGEPIADGPESFYIGGAAGGSLEWWDATRKFSLFLSSGGGVGWMDARGHEIKGAQGQDFNFNWYIHSGMTWRVREQLSISLGAYFQHVSNRGEDEVNPGVNALGPMLGVVWHF